jgi:hypothetical protein
VANAIGTGAAIAASDGSLKAGLGTAAFVVEDSESCGRLKESIKSRDQSMKGTLISAKYLGCMQLYFWSRKYAPCIQ